MKDSIERIVMNNRSDLLIELAKERKEIAFESIPSVNVTAISVVDNPFYPAQGDLFNLQPISDEDRAVVHSRSDFDEIDEYERVIHVKNRKCNDYSRESISLSRFSQLRVFAIGDYCMKKDMEFVVLNMPELEEVTVGKSCFSSWEFCGSIPDRTFILKDCPKLKSLKIGDSSFYSYTVCEIGNTPSLQQLCIGSHSFRYLKELVISGMNDLSTVTIGDQCCCKSAGGVFEVKNCNHLESLRIGRSSFGKWKEFTLEECSIQEVVVDDGSFVHCTTASLVGMSFALH